MEKLLEQLPPQRVWSQHTGPSLYIFTSETVKILGLKSSLLRAGCSAISHMMNDVFIPIFISCQILTLGTNWCSG